MRFRGWPVNNWITFPLCVDLQSIGAPLSFNVSLNSFIAAMKGLVRKALKATKKEISSSLNGEISFIFFFLFLFSTNFNPIIIYY